MWSEWTVRHGRAKGGTTIPVRLEYEEQPGAVEEVELHALVFDRTWEVVATYRRSPDGPRLAGLRFEPRTEDPDILGARLLRQLRQGAISDAFDAILRRPGVTRELGDPAWSRQRRRPGRAGGDPLVYAEWAERYVQACAEAPGRPVQHLIETSDEHLTPNQVYARNHRAWQEGMLTKARGRQPRALTKKARTLLDKQRPRAAGKD
jgi:hypothetical protein